MCMFKKKGDDTNKVKKLTRLHLFLVLLIAVFVVPFIMKPFISYYNLNQRENATVDEVHAVEATEQQFLEFMDDHTSRFMTARNDLAQFDELYFRVDPVKYRSEMDEYVDGMIALCEEVAEAPKPDKTELAELRGAYVLAMENFKKGAEVYPQAYEDQNNQELVEAEEHFKKSRAEFDYAMQLLQAYGGN